MIVCDPIKTYYPSSDFPRRVIFQRCGAHPLLLLCMSPQPSSFFLPPFVLIAFVWGVRHWHSITPEKSVLSHECRAQQYTMIPCRFRGCVVKYTVKFPKQRNIPGAQFPTPKAISICVTSHYFPNVIVRVEYKEKSF